MASYRGHLMFSTTLGAAYAGVGFWQMNLDWGPALLGAGVTALGGLLPDLDSDSGVPVREMFNLAATVTPLLLLHRLRQFFSPEQTIVLLGGVYLFIRYVVSHAFKRYTVHRGMFHSIPAMLIAGLAVFLIYNNPDDHIRWFVAAGVMLGFLSHLVLDEMCSVDFTGAKLKLNKYAGSAVKFWSPSASATFAAYLVLFLLGAAVWMSYNPPAPDIGSIPSKRAATR
jgi:hypothetical protein